MAGNADDLASALVDCSTYRLIWYVTGRWKACLSYKLHTNLAGIRQGS
jgi:hypothetical protein